MTKRKMNALLLLSILIVYLICTTVSFFSVRTYTEERFYALNREAARVQAASPSYDTVAPYLADCYDAVRYANDRFPIDVFAIDCRTNEVIRQDSSFLLFAREDIPDICLDEYMTDRVKRQLNRAIAASHFNDPRDVTVTRFDYCIQNGKVIPVNLYLSNFDVWRETKVHLTDYAVTNTLAADTDGADADDASAPSVTISLCGIDSHSYNNKIYTYFREHYNASYRPEAEEEAADSLPFLTDQVYFFDAAIGGQPYKIGIAAACDVTQETLHSGEFFIPFCIETVFFFLFAVMALAYSSLLYDKHRELTEAKQAFAAAAAHELKTPLAIIQNQSECILENIAPERNQEYTQSIYDESLRMNGLVAELLQYQRLASAAPIRREPCSLTDIVKTELEQYRVLMDAKHITLAVNVRENCIIRANADCISLAVDNYLSNAVKHTAENGTIMVTLKKAGRAYRFSVFNEGKDIPSPYKEHLWDLFSRGGQTYAAHTDGSTGMGLALCKRIFELHRFAYGCRSKANGVEFYFTAK